MTKEQKANIQTYLDAISYEEIAIENSRKVIRQNRKWIEEEILGKDMVGFEGTNEALSKLTIK